jgi:hypothetical protein
MRLVGHLIVACLAAGWAIVEAIMAKPDGDLSLAQATILFAVALVFGHLALHATVFGLGSGCHERTLARLPEQGKFRW